MQPRPAHFHHTRGGAQQAGEPPEQGRLARPRRAEQRHGLPLGQGEVDAAQRGDLLAGCAVHVDHAGAAAHGGRGACHAGASRSWSGSTPWASVPLAVTAATARTPIAAPSSAASGPGVGTYDSGGAAGWVMNSGTLRTTRNAAANPAPMPTSVPNPSTMSCSVSSAPRSVRLATPVAARAAYSYRRLRADRQRARIAAPAASSAPAAASARNSTLASPAPL